MSTSATFVARFVTQGSVLVIVVQVIALITLLLSSSKLSAKITLLVSELWAEELLLDLVLVVWLLSFLF